MSDSLKLGHFRIKTTGCFVAIGYDFEVPYGSFRCVHLNQIQVSRVIHIGICFLLPLYNIHTAFRWAQRNMHVWMEKREEFIILIKGRKSVLFVIWTCIIDSSGQCWTNVLSHYGKDGYFRSFLQFFFILNQESCQPNIQSIWDQIGQAFKWRWLVYLF